MYYMSKMSKGSTFKVITIKGVWLSSHHIHLFGILMSKGCVISHIPIFVLQELEYPKNFCFDRNCLAFSFFNALEVTLNQINVVK